MRLSGCSKSLEGEHFFDFPGIVANAKNPFHFQDKFNVAQGIPTGRNAEPTLGHILILRRAQTPPDNGFNLRLKIVIAHLRSR